MGQEVETFGEVLTMNSDPKYTSYPGNLSDLEASYGIVNLSGMTGISNGFQFTRDPNDQLYHVWHATMPSDADMVHEPGFTMIVQRRILTRLGKGFVERVADAAPEEPDFDELYETYPEIMEQVDSALDDNDSTVERLTALGKIDFPIKSFETILAKNYSAYLHTLLDFSDLPYVISDCNSYGEFVADDGEAHYQAVEHDGSIFYAKLITLCAVPLLEMNTPIGTTPKTGILAVKAKIFLDGYECYGTFPLRTCKISELFTRQADAASEQQ
jgi:hypothetical protein